MCTIIWNVVILLVRLIFILFKIVTAVIMKGGSQGIPPVLELTATRTLPVIIGCNSTMVMM